MAYPPPPGHASLPPRPPPSNSGPSSGHRNNNGNNGSSFKPAFTGFAPRAVASSHAHTARTGSPAQYTAHYGVPPSTIPYPNISVPGQTSQYHVPPQSYDSSTHQAGPQIRNPFSAPPGISSSTSTSASANIPHDSYDAEYEAQVQQWQSAYMSKDGDRTANNHNSNSNTTNKPSLNSVLPTSAVPSRTDTPTQSATSTAANGGAAQGSSTQGQGQDTDGGKQRTVQRSGGGTSWNDSSLLEWDPAHFRIFVGNLAGEVTDDSLLKAFAKFSSVQKARVIRDKRTTKSRGYGFVSFSDGDDYFNAAREMQGKYIGSHPVLIKRAVTEVRATNVPQNKGKNKHKGGHGGGSGKGNGSANANAGSGEGGAGGHSKVDHGGIHKKQPKTKGGLKIIG